MNTQNFFGISGGGFYNYGFHPVWAILLTLVILWDLVWRAIGLWHAAHNGQRNWFIALFVVNSLGILPILYLKFWQRKQKSV